MVEHIEFFNRYPWGTESYNKLLGSLSQALKDRKAKFDERCTNKNGKHMGESYDVGGCPYVLLIWMFEAIPLIGSNYAITRDGMVPRILKWTNTHTIPESACKFLLDEPRKKKKNQPVPALVAISAEVSQPWYPTLASVTHASIRVKLPKLPKQLASSSIRQPQAPKATQVPNVKHSGDSEFEAYTEKHEEEKFSTTEVRSSSDGLDLLCQQLLDHVCKLSQQVEVLHAEMNNRLDVISSDIKMLKETNIHSPLHHPQSPIAPPSAFFDVHSEVPSAKVYPPSDTHHSIHPVSHDDTPSTTVATPPVAPHVPGPFPTVDNNVVYKQSMFGRIIKKSKQLVSPYTADYRVSKRAKPMPSVTLSYEEWKESDKYLLELGDSVVEPSWFTPLQSKNGWLDDSHVDAWLYMLRDKQQREVGWVSRSTSMDCFFYFRMKSFWASFGENLENGLLPHTLYNYFYGMSPLEAKPWHEVDEVLIPVNMPNHWVLVHVDLIERTLTVYDSLLSIFGMSEVLFWMRCLAESIPRILRITEFGHRRPQHCTSIHTFKISRLENGVPQQHDGSSCGVYMLKFAECLARGAALNRLPSLDAQTMRMRVVSELFHSGKIRERVTTQPQPDSQDDDVVSLHGMAVDDPVLIGSQEEPN